MTRTHRILFIIYLIVSILALAYVFLRVPLISALYHSDRPFAGLMSHRSQFSLEHYLRFYDDLVKLNLTAIFGFGALCWLASRAFSSVSQFRFFALLLAADFLFLVFGQIRGGNFSLTLDGGYPERFQYLKEIVSAAIFLGLYAVGRRPLFAATGSFFFYFFLDDAFEYHEHVGRWLAVSLPLDWIAHPLGLKPISTGELIMLAFPMIFFSGWFIASYLRENSQIQSVARRLAAMIALLVFCGVVMDVVGDRITEAGSGPALKFLSLLGEDFGEMAVMSFITAQAAALWLKREELR